MIFTEQVFIKHRLALPSIPIERQIQWTTYVCSHQQASLSQINFGGHCVSWQIFCNTEKYLHFMIMTFKLCFH